MLECAIAALKRIFQSTLPRGGATVCREQLHRQGGISIHAPTGGSDHNREHGKKGKTISIHAPTGGSDREYAESITKTYDFNPRSHGGERQPIANVPDSRPRFQSTLPRGGATQE